MKTSGRKVLHWTLLTIVLCALKLRMYSLAYSVEQRWIIPSSVPTRYSKSLSGLKARQVPPSSEEKF